MFFTPGNHQEHGLAHNPFKAIVAPRPIGWIGSYSEDGVANLAPYSFFNAICDQPPLVAFSSAGIKDSVRNIEASSAFSCSIVSSALTDAMNVSSAAVDEKTSEFELAGLVPSKCQEVNAPYVREAPAVLECKHVETKRLADSKGVESHNYLVIGEVVGIHLDENVIVDGKLDLERFNPLARLGYMDYAAVERVFSLQRPEV